MKRLPSRVLGLALVGALALHTASKDAAHLQEMLWLCHVATLLMALGLLAGWHRWVAGGFLLHVAFGTVGWFIDVLETRDTTLSSVLVHMLPLVAGALEVRWKGWPSSVVLPTWLFFTLWVISCHWTTDPALNVNMAHAPWGPLAHVLGGVWVSGAFNSAVLLGLFVLTDAVLRRLNPAPSVG
ncbi:hypothetical protein [Hyalangium sp.]|uniref:hypothetical protein n=1 Tax=Hyalangium sp. TaxID=2028555 RepID=UPI002D47682E|nr:hypothetical protein [Hyalangium sp.]HYH97126.1 hypothetical protein [Hyalangium sp.]